MTMRIAMSAAKKVWLCNTCEDVIAEPVALYECAECVAIFSR